MATIIDPALRKLIKSKTPQGLKGILIIYFESNSLFEKIFKFLKDYKWSLLISITVTIVCCLKFGFENLYSILLVIDDKLSSMLPNLLGFNLGAYTLFVAFGGENFIKQIVYYRKDDKYSIYQKNSAIFAFSLLFQIVFLLLSFVIGLIISMNISFGSIVLRSFINLSAIWLLIFGAIGSVAVLKDIIVNIFNLSQHYHFSLWSSENPTPPGDNSDSRDDNTQPPA
jgi:hypothetical protein